MARQYTRPTRQSYRNDHRHVGVMPATPSINTPDWCAEQVRTRLACDLTLFSSAHSDFVGVCLHQTWVVLVATPILSVRVCTPDLSCTGGNTNFVGVCVCVHQTWVVLVATPILSVRVRPPFGIQRQFINKSVTQKVYKHLTSFVMLQVVINQHIINLGVRFFYYCCSFLYNSLYDYLLRRCTA